jgi:MIP family channel proteins
MDNEPLHRGFAEFVGTFAIVVVAAGTILATPILFAQFFSPQAAAQGGTAFARGLALVSVALAYGLIVAVMASAVGHISGGHFNPAITLGFLVTRRIAPVLAVVYWIAQFGAAALAALLLRWIFPQAIRNPIHLAAPTRSLLLTDWKAVVVEAVVTFAVTWVVFATTADPRGTFSQIAGLAYGLAIAAGVFFAGALTDGIMNPARAFGPQLVQSDWTSWWIWYLGPFVGAVLAALIYEYMYLTPTLRPGLPLGPEPVPVGPEGALLAEESTVADEAPGGTAPPADTAPPGHSEPPRE